ncbi:MAG: hypothetical protein U9Q06_01680 [Nanoarchaeota archaeon]|nr:hypothetical protein [Nanoarchaeota archaeon]
MKIKKLKKVEALEVVFEIMTLVIGIISFAFIVSSVGGFVGAEESNIGEEDGNEGEDSTGEEIYPADIGCCFDSEEGICSPNSLVEDCEAGENGNWFDKPLCDISECERGCCLFGFNAQFVTQRRCSKLAEINGVPGTWDISINDELECVVGLSGEDDIGACVVPIKYEEENNCKFTTRSECSRLDTGQGVSFHGGKLCSHPDLETVCEKQDSVNCDDGMIYWFDSCGNRENIYEKSKIRSWNNGEVLSEDESCSGLDRDNINSDRCGKCNYELGSICGEFQAGVDRGNMEGFTCRDLNCKDAIGNAGEKEDRINGESWCVYDGQVGDTNIGTTGKLSADVVGSRHYKYSCINGEVVSEECDEYRRQICVEKEKTVGSKTITNGICRPNLWQQCFGYNNELTICEEECMEKCENNPDCSVQEINVDDHFRYNMCVPKFPPGFDLGSVSGINDILRDMNLDEGQFTNPRTNVGDTSGEGICAIGTRGCLVVFKKKCTGGGWKCIENCDCMTEKFTTQMNNLCVSLGDCGVYTNWDGVETDRGASITKKGSKGHLPPLPETLMGNYGVFANAVASQFIESAVYDEEEEILELDRNGMRDSFMEGYSSSLEPRVPEEVELLDNMLNPVTLIGLIGAGIWILLGAGPGGWIALIVVIIISFILSIFGCNKIKTVEIQFHCEPWERPNVGDCAKCTEDKMKPCTQYRCQSLGKNCNLLNEGTEFAECMDVEFEESIPLITAWEEILSEGYKYTFETTNGFRIRQSNGDCVDPYSPIVFGVQTDIYSKCTIATDSEMSDAVPFLEGSRFSKNHTYMTYMPSVDAQIASEVNSPEEFQQAREELNQVIDVPNLDEDILEDLEDAGVDISSLTGQTYHEMMLDQAGDIDFYVKCENVNGNANEHDYKINFCVNQGPDHTPPAINAIAPEDGSFIRFDAESQEVVAYITEPSECKWSVTQPTGSLAEKYSALENSMECEQEADAGGALGYSCTADLPTVAEENKFYILCRDQPWLGESEERNYGAKEGGVYEYVLKKTENKLEIEYIKPSGTFVEGTEPININLEVKTKGGVEEGKAVCEYDFGEDFSDRFLETGSDIHKHFLTNMVAGDYTFEVSCKDGVGNVAVGKSSFKLELDVWNPEITRVYHSSGDLVIITNEDATCYYGVDETLECGFETDETTMMGEGSSRIHNLEWNPDKIHYIKCKDIWGNMASDCLIIVKPDDEFA